MVAEVPLDARDSVYAAAGDWVPACWGGVLAAFVVCRPRPEAAA